MTCALLGMTQGTASNGPADVFTRLLRVSGLAYFVARVPILCRAEVLDQGNERSAAILARRALDGQWFDAPGFDASLATAVDLGNGPAGPVMTLFQGLGTGRATLPVLAAHTPLKLLVSPCKSILTVTPGSPQPMLINWSNQHIALDAHTLPDLQGETLETVHASGRDWPSTLTWLPVGGTLHAWQTVWLRRSTLEPRFF